MPTFRFRCTGCGKEMELRVATGVKTAGCLLCGAEMTKLFTPCHIKRIHPEWGEMTSTDVFGPAPPRQLWSGFSGKDEGGD